MEKVSFCIKFYKEFSIFMKIKYFFEKIKQTNKQTKKKTIKKRKKKKKLMIYNFLIYIIF